MPTTDTTALILDSLRGFATAAELSALPPDDDLREAFELDSMDFLTFVERLAGTTGIRIEEDDYPRLRTMNSTIEFLASRGLGS
ncbi:acyl carrier protein [Amycolatopsis sp. NPDC059657]|uniref:acyl carrier protein n=1 Tax=Amycolatopsis sp. NPDC059657 TaxID=3346899 RepID=UPI0036730633